MNANAPACPQASLITVPRDFIILCLWSAYGLALSSLLVFSGFGADFAQALAAAG
jgi:hypothetical protein